MYKLEERILFDAAAVADVADAQQEAEAQEEAAETADNAEETAVAEQEAIESGEVSEATGEEADPLEDILVATDLGLGSDGQRLDVLLISSSLDNADDIFNAADADTLVIEYDARITSASELLAQITSTLDGRMADSIAFAILLLKRRLSYSVRTESIKLAASFLRSLESYILASACAFQAPIGSTYPK